MIKNIKKIILKQTKIIVILKKTYEFFVRTTNPRGFEDNDTLYAFYDGRSSIDYGEEFERLAWISYDIAPFLFLAEIARRKKKLTKMFIVLYFNNKNFYYKNAHWKFYNIVLQNLSVLPAISGYCVCSSTTQLRKYWGKNWRNAYPYDFSYFFPKEGYKLKNSNFDVNEPLSNILTINSEALKLINEWVCQNVGKKKLVTITLRECDEYSKRNSNVRSWVKFAKELNPNEYYIIFLRDSYKAFENINEDLNGMNTFNAPLYNIQLRLALYKVAFMNMGVNNGCCTYFLLCNFNSLFFVKLINDIDEYAYASESHWREMELEPGKTERFNFNSKNVRLVWAHDTYDVIKEEFYKMVDELAKV